ncbi:MAG: T9SS type A sorting domain-containing protein [Spirosomataceae bacterium]
MSNLTAGTTYNFTVTNAEGCVSTASANVGINAQPSTPIAPRWVPSHNPPAQSLPQSVILNNLSALACGRSTGEHFRLGHKHHRVQFNRRNHLQFHRHQRGGLRLGGFGEWPSMPNPTHHCLTVGTITQPTCAVATGSVILNNLPATGTWTLNPGNISGTGTSTTVSGLAAATYNFTVTNAEGCVSAASANVVINAQPNTPAAPTVGTITQPTCAVATGSVVLNNLPASGTWTLNPGNISGTGTSTTVTGLVVATYNFTVTNAEGCVSAASANVVINAQPNTPATPAASVTQQPDCTTPTGTITVTAPTGSDIQYSVDGINYQPVAIFSGLAPNTYSVTAKNTLTGCISAALPLTVNVSPSTVNIVAGFSGPNPVCQGSPTALLPTTGGSWSSNDPAKATVTADGQITTLLPGTVTFTFTTPQGCTALSPALTIKPTPSSGLTASQVDVCPNTTVTLDAHCSIPTATVNWNPGAPTVIPDAANIAYVYRARCESDGCAGNESSVEVRTHRILVDMKEVGTGLLPQPLSGTVIANMAPTSIVTAATSARRWTFLATGCTSSEAAVFKLMGPVSFNTIDNGAPYAMFANEETNFYSIEHPNYGNGGSFPNGTYGLTVDLRSQDGVGGPFPKNRAAAGVLLATRSLQFTVQSPQAMVGSRQAMASENEERRTENGAFAQVMPNPIAETLRLQVMEAKGQTVNVHLTEVSGRTVLQRAFVSEAHAHLEEFDVSHLSGGMYLLRVTAGDKQNVVKVIKAQ